MHVHVAAPPVDVDPGEQPVQLDAPTSLYALLGHWGQVERPGCNWYVPAVQLVQVLATGAPMAVEKVPMVQLVQVVWPVRVWYEPAGQNKHATTEEEAPVATPYVPVAHGRHAG